VGGIQSRAVEAGGTECLIMQKPPPRSGKTKAGANRLKQGAPTNLANAAPNARTEMFGTKKVGAFFGSTALLVRPVSIPGCGSVSPCHGGAHEGFRGRKGHRYRGGPE
jgi:hypothetical protein